MAHQWEYERHGWQDLTREQRRIIESIELDFMPLRRTLKKLNEAELSNDQVSKIFKSAEDVSREKNLRTGFGRAAALPKDALIKVNRILDNFGRKLQESTPVKNFDKKFADIQAGLRAKLDTSKAGKMALASVDALGNIANSKHGAIYQAAVVGLLSAIAGLALGPAMIPVAAVVLRGATELVKGSSFSTAAGKSIKAGVLGFIGAQVASALVDWFDAVRVASITPVGKEELGIGTMNFSASRSITGVNGMEWTRSFRINGVTVDPEMRGQINQAILRIGSGDVGAYDRLLRLAQKVSSAEYAAELSNKLGAATAEKINNDGFLKSIRSIKDYVVAAAGGAATAAGDVKGKEKTTEGKKLSLPVMEGLWADLTLRFGAGKLTKAWKQAGRPTDSVDVARMLADMGMDADDIREAFVNAGIPDDDVDATMTALARGDDDELEIPFVTGFKKLDDEAKEILRTQGKDAFTSYWEKKLKELEDEEKAKDASSTAELINDFRSALKSNDADRAKTLVSSLTNLSSATQRKLRGLLLTATGMPEDERKTIDGIIMKATVTEMEMFERISGVLRENGRTWKSLGYQQVMMERRSGAVILL